MRMLKLALVLFVLASFIVAVTAVATAAATPTAKPKVTATAKPVATMMPTKKPGKLIDLNQMKYNVDSIYKKLMAGVKMPGSAAYNKSSKGAAPVTELNKSGGMTNQTKGAAVTAKPTVTAKPKVTTKPSMKLSTPGMRSMPAPLAMGAMPQLAGNKTKTR